MRCRRCGKKLAKRPVGQSKGQAVCPYCGETRSRWAGDRSESGASGVFQTSMVLIAAEGAEMVYRSMEEVPQPLRSKLRKSTNGANSATILIADRRGREEISRVMRSLGQFEGAAPQRGSLRSPWRSLLAGRPSPQKPAWLAARRKKATAAAILLLTVAIVALLFTHFRVAL